MIALQAADFHWIVATNDHQWITADLSDGKGEQPVLTDLVPVGTAGYRTSLPLRDHSGLFREFASTPCDKASIAAFANRHGMLGKSSIMPIPAGPDGGLRMGSGEPFTLWKNELGDLQRCVALHEAAKKADTVTLERHILWSDHRVEYRSHADWKPADGLPAGETRRFTMISQSSVDAERLKLLRPGDLVTPALWFVQSEVNQRLSEETCSRLLWDIDTSRLVSRIVPKTLLGAMWLQFALAIERGSDCRTCAQCGKWFEFSPGTSRSDKQFCSTACRVKAYRLRKLEGTDRDLKEGVEPGSGEQKSSPPASGKTSGRRPAQGKATG